MTISGSEVSLIGVEQSFPSCQEMAPEMNLKQKQKTLFRLIYPLDKYLHFLRGDEKSLKYYQLPSFEIDVLVRTYIVILICFNYTGLLSFILQ